MLHGSSEKTIYAAVKIAVKLHIIITIIYNYMLDIPQVVHDESSWWTLIMLSDIYIKFKTLNGEGRNGLIKFTEYKSREKSTKPKIGFLKRLIRKDSN